MLPETAVFRVPFLGLSAASASEMKNNVIFLKKTLARLAKAANLRLFFSKTREVDRQNRLTTCLNRVN